MVRRYADKLQDNPEHVSLHLKKYETMAEDGTFDVLPKKEVIQIKKEMEKLEKNLGGIKEMKNIFRMQSSLLILRRKESAYRKHRLLEFTLIGIADTNCDPEELDYRYPG